MSSEPIFTIKSAAQACGVSESTIRRKRSDLQKYGAVETKNGWQIPASALIATGLPLDKVISLDKSDRLSMTGQYQPANDSPSQGEIDALRAQNALLQQLLATEQRRVDYLQEQLAQANATTRALLPPPPTKRTLWQRLTGRTPSPDTERSQ